MSEADSPNKDSGLTRSVEPVESVPTDIPVSGQVPETASAEDWQTVDFPGAMSVDAIPVQANPPAPTTANQDSEVLAALASLNPTSDAEVTPPIPSEVRTDGEADPTLVQRLQQESQELRDRLAQLEQDLAQQQIELQLEMARSLYSASAETDSSESTSLESASSTATGEANQPDATAPELVMGQGRINQLFHELELAQQTAQRQQILVETLSEQLESSQERIAQLERDCALAQQRYNEQIQQLLQAETTCRDLRMRLHRQQQQTLQFKAALEKCLEMPAPSTHFIAISETGTSAPLPTVPVAPTPLASGLIPKNQPVRPWVAPMNQERSETDGSMPKLLSKLLNPDPAIAANMTEFEAQTWVPSPDEAQTAAAWVNQIFTNATDPAYATSDIDARTDIFDLSPFLESEAIQATSPTDMSDASVTDPAKDAGLLQMLASVPLASDELVTSQPFYWGGSQGNSDPLWEDLAKLIDPSGEGDTRSDSNQAKPEIAPTLPFSGPAAAPSEPTFPIVTDTGVTPMTPKEESAKDHLASTNQTNKKPLELISWASRSQRVGERSLQLQATPLATSVEVLEPSATPSDLAEPSTSVESGDTDHTPGENDSKQKVVAAASWPSPVVYPLRSSKKLKSLSAVDLPTFPKAR